MVRVSECRDCAEQCRAMAKTARNEAQKELFLQLANEWEACAKARQKLRRLKRKVQQPFKQ